ncbi:MAG: 30S ribosomal protein S4 [Erysipelotrichales bacterium]|nr:30S ribosomal protein S4 [Erysipelotrichales bacterium]
MSRYTGPSWKISRRLGFSTLETGVELKKRNYAPGKAPTDKRKKLTEYGKQLAEKQKLREMYGVNERQFQRLFMIASNSNEVTGLAFMRILESRLDNLVYRMGFARTRRAARQLVNHGHILVNGKKVDIPSYLCSVNDVIAVKEASRELKVINESLESMAMVVPYVTVDKAKKEGTFLREPERKELAQDIQEAQIVEFYNRKL